MTLEKNKKRRKEKKAKHLQLNTLSPPKCFDTNWALRVLTSTGISQFSAPQEAQVASPRPDSLGVSEAKLGVEVVSMQGLLTVNCVVACGVVGTAHPDLLHTGMISWWSSTSVALLIKVTDLLYVIVQQYKVSYCIFRSYSSLYWCRIVSHIVKHFLS